MTSSARIAQADTAAQTADNAAAGADGGRTAWARNLAAPVRDFLSTETGGAAAMLGAVVVALVWANSPWSHSYATVWSTDLEIRIGSHALAADLRTWVNEGLMTLFFLVVGLEAKRQLDLGDLRERRRLIVPALAALGGIAAPIAIYLAFNAGGAGGHAWGAAMSTDTAFALAAVALLAPRTSVRLRVFLLTLAVVDDLCALVVITLVYTRAVSVAALAVAIGLFACLLALRFVPTPGRGPAAIVLGLGVWVAMFESGVDPVISGLAIGLATTAYPPSREDLERATELAHSFREQPTPELARTAQRGLLSAISLNDRLQYRLHPWVSYAVVPLFALANAGIHLTGSLLGDAIASPITLGIVLGYVIGKPLGVTAGAWIASRPRLHGPRLPVSVPVLLLGGGCAGIGFTISLLISSRALSGSLLDQAKLGALATLVLAPLTAAIARAAIARLPASVRARQVAGTAQDILDLAVDVDPRRDHIRGPADAPVTLVEYGDFECEYCGRAEEVIRQLLSASGGDVRYVWRQLPLNDVHVSAQLSAEASEAAGAQGRFWEMYDLLIAHQGALGFRDLVGYAEQLGLDVERFSSELRRGEYEPRVSEDVASADESGVSGTPTFFINGRRHYGVYDIATLTTAVAAAKRRAELVRAA